MKSDWLLLSVDTSAITVLLLEATLGCIYGRNEMQPATLQYAPALTATLALIMIIKKCKVS